MFAIYKKPDVLSSDQSEIRTQRNKIHRKHHVAVQIQKTFSFFRAYVILLNLMPLLLKDISSTSSD